ncbi:hypothetical protein DTO280E4_4005 [Paecilomyces variotii]|nr:hypothetical protein DTO032I3_2454 [Paecilomyces variotii]KAJ9280236.1 hypothetical protein DTO021D3_2824 [Paecilomyces variotii]KAJ9343050.1 hypothetical protein DTO027B6_4325 [Paecilomyces variotii]KAJ9359748.1 hypothetical protein DTO027B9_1796 [Paecilomyces variotii]KAJ9361258.1 hypothetical protein DTO280E4_4005 [Paecilomyces variotii]
MLSHMTTGGQGGQQEHPISRIRYDRYLVASFRNAIASVAGQVVWYTLLMEDKLDQTCIIYYRRVNQIASGQP